MRTYINASVNPIQKTTKEEDIQYKEFSHF